MAFRVKGRILLELGAELISTDAIALYELVKNSIDAGARKTTIRVMVALQHSQFGAIRNLLEQTGDHALTREEILEQVEARIEPGAPQEKRDKLLEALAESRSKAQLRTALETAYLEANEIEIADDGHGMSLSELDELYLTIGTPARLLEKRALFQRYKDSEDAPRPPLGEKGIGRLAAMRLGEQLEVQTARKEDKNWNLLSVDWSILNDPRLDLQAVPAEPEAGPAKDTKGQSGTIIRTLGLTADWSQEKLMQLARTEFAKLFDPLTPGRRDNIELVFNGVEVVTPAFDNKKLSKADANCKGEFRVVNGVPTLTGTVEYKLFGKTKTFKVDSVHLESAVKVQPGRPNRKKKPIPNSEAIAVALSTVGPFQYEFHWFNRGRLMRDEPLVWANIGSFVTQWSGGLLVYRDGYRVYPYGAPDDDWLDLDRKALAAGAYKFNRAQIIGRVRLSSRFNSELKDQTNREGFRENPEKHALIRLLRHVIISEVRSFLEDVNDEMNPIDKDEIDNIGRRLESSQREAIRRVKEIGRRVPGEQQAVTQLLDYLKDVTLAWERAKSLAQSFDADLEKYIHLAGVGLMVEFIAHELTRATQSALSTLEQSKAKSSPPNMETLRAQLKTIEKRLRILDPMSVPGRHRYENQDVRGIFEEVCDAHAAQFDRHGIAVDVTPKLWLKFMSKVEKGQIIQIFENLIANSVYWIKARRIREDFAPRIVVRFDNAGRQVSFSDNGPGIPEERGEEVFRPFFTTKPPGDGRGLGLFIAQKLAEYNDAKLTLMDAEAGVHQGFVLTFNEAKKDHK